MSSQIDPNRVLNRMGSRITRELTKEEIESVSPARPSCRLTFTHLPE